MNQLNELNLPMCFVATFLLSNFYVNSVRSAQELSLKLRYVKLFSFFGRQGVRMLACAAASVASWILPTIPYYRTYIRYILVVSRTGSHPAKAFSVTDIKLHVIPIAKGTMLNCYRSFLGKK